MYSFQIKLDIDKDLKNRVDGCNRVSHGKNWIESLSPEYQETAKKLVGLNYEEAKEFMIAFLNDLYIKNKLLIYNVSIQAKKLFSEKLEQACICMEKLTQRPIYRKDFTIYLTTFPRGPYDYQSGSIWTCVFWNINNFLGNFLHELQHFQVIHYYKGSDAMKDLTNEQFEFLKESLTVVLNDSCKEFLAKPDNGYALHQEFRKVLWQYWNNEKDFEKLIEYGSKMIKELLK